MKSPVEGRSLEREAPQGRQLCGPVIVEACPGPSFVCPKASALPDDARDERKIHR